MDEFVFELDVRCSCEGYLTLYLRVGCRSLTRKEGALPGCCKAAPSVLGKTNIIIGSELLRFSMIEYRCCSPCWFCLQTCCRTGPPGYIGWRDGTTTLCQSQLCSWSMCWWQSVKVLFIDPVTCWTCSWSMCCWQSMQVLSIDPVTCWTCSWSMY
jgi:hypothetical protein